MTTCTFGSVKLAVDGPLNAKSAVVVSVNIIRGTVVRTFLGTCTIFGASFGSAAARRVIVGPDVAADDTELASALDDAAGLGIGEAVGIGLGELLGDGLPATAIAKFS